MEETTRRAGGLREHPAAGAGAVGAAIALVGAALSWPGEPLLTVEGFGSPVAALLAVVALAAFLGRRRGLLDRGQATPVAAIAGLGLAVLAAVRLVRPAIGVDVAPLVGPGLGMTMLAGMACVGLAIADYRGAGADDLTAMGVGIALAVVLTVVGFGVQIFLTLLLRDAIVATRPGEIGTILVGLLAPVTLVGFVIVGVTFLLVTDRGLGWIDVAVPSLKEVGYVVVGVLGLIGVQIVVAVATYVLEIPSSENAVVDIVRLAADAGYARLILLLVPLQLLVVGPAEELLFRGVIQKYLYESFSRRGAVLVASLVFAAAHVMSYWDANPAALFVSLASVFLLALVLGTIYERTDNLVVPALVHGTFNSILVALLYLSVVAGELNSLLP